MCLWGRDPGAGGACLGAVFAGCVLDVFLLPMQNAQLRSFCWCCFRCIFLPLFIARLHWGLVGLEEGHLVRQT